MFLTPDPHSQFMASQKLRPRGIFSQNSVLEKTKAYAGRPIYVGIRTSGIIMLAARVERGHELSRATTMPGNIIKAVKTTEDNKLPKF